MTELLYQTDSYLQTFDAAVTALDEDSVRAALEAAARAEGATPPPASSAASTSPTTSTDD